MIRIPFRSTQCGGCHFPLFPVVYSTVSQGELPKPLASAGDECGCPCRLGTLSSEMIADLLEKLRSAVGDADELSDTAKTDLLSHVAAMEASAGGTAVTAEAGLVESPGQAESLKGLSTSIEGLEAAHPEITDLVNHIATALGNMGI